MLRIAVPLILGYASVYIAVTKCALEYQHQIGKMQFAKIRVPKSKRSTMSDERL
jgi:hypothetical protein